MTESLTNAATVLLIFLIGYTFKKFNLCDISFARKLSYVIMYVTLPCAILSGSQGGLEMEYSLFFIVPIAFVISFCFPLIGYFLYKRDPKFCVYSMLNLGGFNIGNFILPFMQSTLSTEGFLALCLFDVVNAFFCFGGVYCMALYFNQKGFDSGKPVNLKMVALELSKSVTSYCCILCIVFSSLNITIPSIIMHPVKVMGSSNTFICMFVIGIALNFNMTFNQISRIIKMIFIRYSAALVSALLIAFLLPYSPMVKLILIAIVFAPITSLAPITAIRSLPQFAEDSANLNMMSVIISVVLITVICAFSPALMSIL